MFLICLKWKEMVKPPTHKVLSKHITQAIQKWVTILVRVFKKILYENNLDCLRQEKMNKSRSYHSIKDNEWHIEGNLSSLIESITFYKNKRIIIQIIGNRTKRLGTDIQTAGA